MVKSFIEENKRVNQYQCGCVVLDTSRDKKGRGAPFLYR